MRSLNIPVHSQIRYRVYGLRIGSRVQFPELKAESDSSREVPTDLEFEMGGEPPLWSGGSVVMTWEEPDGTPSLICTKTDVGYRLRYPGLADFLIDHAGRQVRCVAKLGTAPETIRHLFLDQVIPPLLNLRGREALHASAIQTPSGACAFLGASGGGKSTLAAAFHLLGYPVLSDDCLLLKNDADHVSVEPAYPGLRLWDDSRDILFGNGQATLPVAQYTSKRRISTAESSTVGGLGILPLRCIYSLRRHESREPAPHPLVEPLSMRDAFMELVEFSFRLDLTDQVMLLRQMRVLERVAREVPIKRLHLPDDLAALSAAREAILQDLEHG